MVTLTEALEEARNAGGVQTRHVDRLLEQLDPKDAALLETALRGPMSTARLVRALEIAGHPVGRNAINGWRERNGVR